MFKVIGTETYILEIDKWSKVEKEAAEKISKSLAESPLQGKPLGYPFLREKRIGGKRIYYLIYAEFSLVLLVAVSEKKDQQDTIDHIREYLEEYHIIAEKIFKES